MRTRRSAWNVTKTILFLLVVWGIVVIALPLGVSVLEVEAGIQRFPEQVWASVVLLPLSTLLSIWSAMTLAVKGRGTPMPFDPPSRLVIVGPYAYMRHPFAAAVTAQVVGLGVALGSIPVIGYAAVIFTAWYFLVRNREERALVTRFGGATRAYATHVRAFRPRLTPYRGGNENGPAPPSS